MLPRRREIGAPVSRKLEEGKSKHHCDDSSNIFCFSLSAKQAVYHLVTSCEVCPFSPRAKTRGVGGPNDSRGARFF